MKKHLCFIVAFCIVTSIDPVISQKLISNSSITGICYAGNKTNRIYIPPPGEFFKKSGEKGGGSITVKYTGFPNNALAAVEYAASILESILPSDAQITIKARWEKITTSGVLANSSITGYTGGWTIDAQDPHSVYPVALAEKIAGENLNDTLEDITLRINSSIDWYLGTDGNTPFQRYDLVTIVLHEICHGLGFFDSMNTDNNVGWYGVGSIPLIYDTFIENYQGKRLTDSLIFKNYSYDLLRELTGGNLYFNGPLLNTYTSGSRARIWAPDTWDSGSSISHLDENQTFEPNTLMTPFIDMGEAIHDPGKFTLSILGDLGWINTRIIHKASHDTETHLNELLLSIRIASDTLYNHERVGAIFSFDKFASRDTLFMTSPGSDDIFNCTITLPSYNSEVQYYFFTEDCFKRVYRSPSLSDTLRYTVYIGTDTVSPVITHTPLISLLEKVDTIKLNAIVTDNLGIDTVYAEYKVNDGQSVFIGFKAGKDNDYTSEINAGSLLLKGGDSIQYRIVAVDSAKAPNSSLLPDPGYFTIHIEDLTTIIESYSTDFSGEATADFINEGFDIYRPIGFTRYGLNSKHPYESPEDNDKTIEYTSILRHPLKFNETGILISFNEIVLVEPGESGSVFGSDEFYDYVILEGSKNFGKKWFKLADGYDSRLLKTWETAYNNSIDGMNSTAVGKESMLHKHLIFCGSSDNISVGDTLLLRFRLFSDPFANGWGWVIEDLKINPLVDDVEEVHSDKAVTVYPNPGNGLIKISTDPGDLNSGKPILYRIFSTSGNCIKSDYLTGEMDNVLDISDRPTGLYIIVFSSDAWIKTIKYSLIK
jgi:hypothetical protein